MTLALVCAVSLVLAALSLAALAVRYEYLVVLRCPRVAIMFLERQTGGRYQLVSPARVPVTVLRFAAHALSLAPDAARRALSRLGGRVPFPVSGKA